MAIKCRFMGEESDIRAVLQAIHDAPGMRVVDTSGARPTRYGEGARVYAVVEATPTQGAQESAPATHETAAAVTGGTAPDA